MIAFNRNLLAMNMMNAQIADRVDLIVSHMLDGEATAAEWAEFETLAAAEPKLWRDLAQSQRDAGALRGALAAAGAVADRVALPTADRAPEIHIYPHPQLRLNRFGAWTGWAAAAIITIIAAVQLRTHSNGHEANLMPTSLGRPSPTSTDAFNNYLLLGKEDGTVLGEMPGRMLVETRPVPQGQGFEVIFIRQVMERRVVPNLYEVTGRDEAGQPTLAPVRPTGRGTM